MSKVLFVVDMQEDFINGALGTPEAQAIVDPVIQRVKEYIDQGEFVVFTKDRHRAFGEENYVERRCCPPHCEIGTSGVEIMPALLEAADVMHHKSHVINKGTFAAWGSLTGMTLRSFLDRASSIELCGVCTDICVISNALLIRSLFPATEVYVNTDLCAGTTPEAHQKAIDVMKSCLITPIDSRTKVENL